VKAGVDSITKPALYNKKNGIRLSTKSAKCLPEVTLMESISQAA
jgi:hypothetical protein